MTQLKELRQQAKVKGIKRYSVMNKDDLILALEGKSIPKRLRKNQVSVGTQMDFPVCSECRVKALVTHLKFKADAEMRKVAYDGDMKIDVETGEVLENDVDYSR